MFNVIRPAGETPALPVKAVAVRSFRGWCVTSVNYRVAVWMRHVANFESSSMICFCNEPAGDLGG